MHRTLEEIKQEVDRQNQKFGEQNHKPIEWIAILSEEVGEAAKEALDHHFKYPKKTDDGSQECNLEIQAQRLKDYREELIQVAAVAVQMIECLDRN